MISINTSFLVILLLFVIFIVIQIYFYSDKYNQNKKLINKMENFESKLSKIKENDKYLLDDESIENLLEDYYKLKNNI